MSASVMDHQKRFQAAVNVIHKLPKKGSYQPSYDVMLRFYGLYKQAVFGPCAVPRPGFWDPVGRYKWDAWSQLGDMSSASAMVAYVDEMKKVAQEVIDTLPMNEKTASLFHHFEPLYAVIDDMPRPPETLLHLREASRVRKDLELTSKSDCEIFCDLVDSVEQLDNLKVPLGESNGFLNGHVALESSPFQLQQQERQIESRQVGAGHGGEGRKDAKDNGTKRRRTNGLESSYHNWRECGVPLRSTGPGTTDGSSGADGGGDGSEGLPEWRNDFQVQQQILLALRKLREDMRSVMERLEAVKALVTTQEEKRWPFHTSAQTVLLFLLWPFAVQGILYLLQKTKRRSRILNEVM
ncbi:acyl-CoA-binding domain-containing protein 4 [Hippocampus zosterae]|uniref:acyl-CoA-binding domain-containing protein 4 n=1 Tax=Hippocampus zosterae TaxID=109293 RepID=UPI00223DC9F0|nr:acyl-CoA-binding domain-containing protein 4 [Hippocampus zosterae]